ncbi:MAG: hypothetical protein KME64_03485 [Scytonematopsis contorta HA4267-MV1]|jgi:hypothetical protein|nr:hypothetical protein [Scytonematopsis contorta HA4267-MV1]
MSKITELKIWDILLEAKAEPLEVDWGGLWSELDISLEYLDTFSQLNVAADALTQMVEILIARSQYTFEEIDAATSNDGPVMSDADFATFVRQSMDIDFDEFIEPLVNSVRKPYEWQQPNEDISSGSVVCEILPQDLLEYVDEFAGELNEEQQQEFVLEIAHAENVSAWVEVITNYLNSQQHQTKISFSQLTQVLPIAKVEIWLGLLLGDFQLQASDYKLQQPDSFNAFCDRFYRGDILVNSTRTI